MMIREKKSTLTAFAAGAGRLFRHRKKRKRAIMSDYRLYC